MIIARQSLSLLGLDLDAEVLGTREGRAHARERNALRELLDEPTRAFVVARVCRRRRRHRRRLMRLAEQRAEAREQLGVLPERARVAFLLTALEGFSPLDIAAIMDAPRVEVENLVAEAGRDIAGQLRTDVLIIEDEPLIALDLRHLVEELGHRVTRIARTHREAVAAVASDRPGLILADIQLADGSSGLEAVDQILGGLEAPVIFVTAFPERYLTGAPPEPAFLISKPFDIDGLKAVISQALFFDRRARRARGGG